MSVFDAVIVQNDTAKPFVALLSDASGILPLSGPTAPSAITIHLRNQQTQVLTTGACTVVPWPTLVAGQSVDAASFTLPAGLAGPFTVEWVLSYVNGQLTIPTRKPLSVLFRRAA